MTGFDKVFANGGTGQFVLTAERTDLDAALRKLSRYCRTETGGEGRIVWGIAPFDSDPDYHVAVENAHTEMRLKRETAYGSPATTLLPLFHELRFRLPYLPAEVDPYRWGGETLRLSTAVQLKREESRDDRRDRRETRGPWSQWMDHLVPRRWSVALRPKDGAKSPKSASAASRGRNVRAMSD